MGRITYNNGGATVSSFADVYVRYNSAQNRYGVYRDDVALGGYRKTSYDIYDNMHYDPYHVNNEEWSAYTIAKMLNANIQSGVLVNEEKIKNILKETGIDATGAVIKVEKPMDTKDINADGKITVTGDIEAGGDIHGKGNETIDGDSHTKGNSEVDGDSTTHGNSTVDGDATTHGNQTADGKLEVKGDAIIGDDKNADKFDVYAQTHLHGDTTIGDDANDKFVVNATSEFKADATFDKNVYVKGDEDIDGNVKIHGDTAMDSTLEVGKDARLHGNTEIDKNLTVHGNEQVDGKLVVGDDATFEKDVLIKGNQEVYGDATIHGSETIDKDIYVKGHSETDGNATVHGNSTVDGDLEAKGNTTLGDNKNKDIVDVNAKTNLHGDTTIGDSDKDKLTVNATSEFKANVEVDKDLAVHGNAVVDQNLVTKGDSYTLGNSTIGKDLTVGGNFHLGGDLILDGSFFSKGAAGFGEDLAIAKDLTVGGDAKVKGDAVVDGDIYGRSFNVGDEKYIDKDGINANEHKIRNVADGEIGSNSLDAVNGRQLWHTREALQHNLNQVGAGAAAMASLHPLDYEHDDKLSVSAAMGNYKDKTAMAAGVFYRPNIKSMFNISGTLGYGDNMFGIGVTTKMGKVTEADTMTDEQLRDKVSEIHDENKELREENGNLKAEVSGLKAKDVSQENQIAALSAKNADLEKSLSDITKAYSQLMSKVDSMAAELENLKATQK